MALTLSTVLRRKSAGAAAPIEGARSVLTAAVHGVAASDKTTGLLKVYFSNGLCLAPGTVRSCNMFWSDDSVASSTARVWKTNGTTDTAITAAVDVATDSIPTTPTNVALSSTALVRGDFLWVDLITGSNETLANFVCWLEVDWTYDSTAS